SVGPMRRQPSLSFVRRFAAGLDLFRQFVVFGHDVVPVFHFIVVFLHEVIALGDEVGDGFILLVNAGVGFLQLRFQCIHGGLVLRDFVGGVLVGELQLRDFGLLRNDELFIGRDGGLDFGEARVHLVHLMVQSGDGIGVALNGGVFFIDHLVQSLDFGALNGLVIPLPGAKAAKAEREDNEQVHLK